MTKSNAVTGCIAIAFYVSATRGNTKDLAELEMRFPGVAGAESVHGVPDRFWLVEDDDGARDPSHDHPPPPRDFTSEDEHRLSARMNLRVEGDPRSHPVWRDAVAALTCTQRRIALARETGKRVHAAP